MRKVDKDERVDKGGAIYERIKRKEKSFLVKLSFLKKRFYLRKGFIYIENLFIKNINYILICYI